MVDEKDYRRGRVVKRLYQEIMETKLSETKPPSGLKDPNRLANRRRKRLDSGA